MDPVLVEVVRGDRVESWHSGIAVVVDANGTILLRIGDVDRSIYLRSAAKPLQALPLVASGAADRWSLTDAEIALACGSHAGEPIHVATAATMLQKAGRDASCLECGVHWPLGEEAARTLAASGGIPSALHNNCSGKHAGFICLACFRGLDPSGYAQPSHPAMREVTAALAETTGISMDDARRGIDGCSIPTFAIPLRALATGFARLGTGHRLSPSLSTAATRIRSAVAANPLMVAGTGRFDTRIATLFGETVLCKCGAEGTAAATVPGQGLGIAVKIDDGAGRAVEVAMVALLQRFLPTSMTANDEFQALAVRTLRNWNGVVVGTLRAC